MTKAILILSIALGLVIANYLSTITIIVIMLKKSPNNLSIRFSKYGFSEVRYYSKAGEDI